MVKVVEDSTSEAGFPYVYWEQEVPTGESAYSRQQSITLKIVAVVMMLVFITVWAASEQFGVAIIVAMLVGGMCLSGDKMFRGGIKVWDVQIPGPEPREGAAEEERRLRAIPILGKQYRGLAVRSQEETDELLLCVAQGSSTDALEWHHWAPLTSVPSLELGTAQEWFEGLADAELRRNASAPNSWVIVAPTLGHGVLWIAESAGSKASIASLHGLLTKRFVVDAPEMLARWKERQEDAKMELALDADRDDEFPELTELPDRRDTSGGHGPAGRGR